MIHRAWCPAFVDERHPRAVGPCTCKRGTPRCPKTLPLDFRGDPQPMKKTKKRPAAAKPNGHANGAAQKPAAVETFKRKFEFALSKTEQVARNTELLTVLDRLEAARTERLSAMSAFKTRIDSLNERKNQLRIALRTHTEEREVDCIERRNEDARTIEIVRLDKEAVIDVRPMMGDELQLELPGTAKKKRGRAGADEATA